jgi:hypothetical protein
MDRASCCRLCKPFNLQLLIYRLTNSNACGNIDVKVLLTVSPFRTFLAPQPRVHSRSSLLPTTHCSLPTFPRPLFSRGRTISRVSPLSTAFTPISPLTPLSTAFTQNTRGWGSAYIPDLCVTPLRKLQVMSCHTLANSLALAKGASPLQSGKSELFVTNHPGVGYLAVYLSGAQDAAMGWRYMKPWRKPGAFGLRIGRSPAPTWLLSAFSTPNDAGPGVTACCDGCHIAVIAGVVP